MQITPTSPQNVLTASVTPEPRPAVIVGTTPTSTAAGVAEDTVVVSDEATDAAAGRVNPKGKAVGHARVAENIEKNVTKLIERETARIVSAGGEASSLDGFKAQVEGIAAAYSADPSASPAKVLSQIRDAVKGLRAGEVTEPVDGEVVTPVDGGVVPVDGVPVGGETLPPVGDEPITVNLSGLRIM